MNFKFLLIDGVLSLNTSKMSDYIERSYYIANEKKWHIHLRVNSEIDN